MGGGAWPFLVGGVICQVNSDNERDLWCKLEWVVEIRFIHIARQITVSNGKLEAITGL